MARTLVAGLLLLATLVGVPAAAAASPAIRLTVRVVVGDGVVHVWQLHCNPVAGSRHPNPAAACRLLAQRGPRIFDPVPKQAMCTMIYGGPQRATVKGVWGRQRISATFNRANGCEIARWNRARALLTLPQPAQFLLSGRVSLGPTCPVQQQGQTCEKPSVDALVIITRAGGDTVTVQATEASGFRVSLPPGTWSVTAVAGMRCAPQPVTLPPSAQVVIPCDTGIR